MNTPLQSTFEAVAREAWLATRVPVQRLVRDTRGNVRRGPDGRPLTRDALKVPRIVCPHCGTHGTPTFAGYRLWVGGDEAPDGPGLYLAALGRCKWSARFLYNLRKLSPKGKHMRAWRPLHDTLLPCGEVFAVTAVRLTDGAEVVAPAPAPVEHWHQSDLERHIENADAEAEASLAGAAG